VRLPPVAATERLNEPPCATVVDACGWVVITGLVTPAPLLEEEDEDDELEELLELELLLELLEPLDEPEPEEPVPPDELLELLELVEWLPEELLELDEELELDELELDELLELLLEELPDAPNRCSPGISKTTVSRAATLIGILAEWPATVKVRLGDPSSPFPVKMPF